MAKQLQLRRGTTEQHASFTGAPGEVTVDTDKKALVVHDGATAGGVPVARAGGNAAQRFKVANAVENDEAMTLGQFRGVTLLADGTNINSLIQSGWYEGNALINRPSGTSWIRVFVIAHGPTTYAQQTAYDFFSDRVWIRRRVESTWQPWAEMAKKSDIIVPPGTVSAYAGWTAPSGWLLCNGQVASRTTHSALFAAIGTLYGEGDGSTTFNLPDLRGEFIRGYDPGLGIDPGRAFASKQLDAVQRMQGSFAGTALVRDTVSVSGVLKQGSHTVLDGPGGGVGGRADQKIEFDSALAARSAQETRPRNVAMNYIIKT